jgi:hypothetical protein
MLGLGYRDGEAPSIGLPGERDERAARALDGDDLLNERGVDVLVEIDLQAPLRLI